MTRFMMTAAALGLFASAAALPQSVAAQTTIPKGSANGCPGGYERGSQADNDRKNPDLCYAKTKNPPTVTQKSRTSAPCPAGLFSESSTSLWCTSRDPSAGVPKETVSGKIAKSNPLDRCPATFYSEPDLKTCISIASSPPPTRAKGAGACRAGEIEEWGKWCTTNNGKMVEGDVTQGHYRDVNTIYQFSGSKTPNGGADIYNTPTIQALFRGGAGGGASAAPASSSNQQSASNTAPTANTNCQTDGSNSGAVLGGAIGGDAGAALGSMLGGFGKKKKKAGC